MPPSKRVKVEDVETEGEAELSDEYVLEGTAPNLKRAVAAHFPIAGPGSPHSRT